MNLLETLTALEISQPTVITVGTFDGVHRGHQQVLAEAREHARARGGLAVAITFQPRPAEVLRPGLPPSYLCSLEQRTAYLRAAGADHVIVVRFTPEIARVSALEFVTTLVERLHMRELVGGPDMALGHRREGTPEVLRRLGDQLGFTLTIVPPLVLGGLPVRSSVVHELILSGDVRRAAELLGRYHAVEGEVVRGDGRGRTLGFPTANIATPPWIVLPSDGIYATYVTVDGNRLPGAASIGFRPTFNGSERRLEVYLLDFDGDLYGKRCSIEFVAFLRPELRFGSISDLVAQMRQDVLQVRDILARDWPAGHGGETSHRACTNTD